MTCDVECFSAVVSTLPLTATVGSTQQTLFCKYTIPETATVERVTVTWIRYSTSTMWNVDSHVGTETPITNEATSSYRAQITGSAANFPDILSQHSITFTLLSQTNAYKYKCSVRYYVTGGNGQRTSSSYFELKIYGKRVIAKICLNSNIEFVPCVIIVFINVKLT